MHVPFLEFEGEFPNILKQNLKRYEAKDRKERAISSPFFLGGGPGRNETLMNFICIN